MAEQFEMEENFGDLFLEAVGSCGDGASLILLLLLAPILYLCHIWERHKKRRRVQTEV